MAAKGSKNEMSKNKNKFLYSVPIVYLLFMVISPFLIFIQIDHCLNAIILPQKNTQFHYFFLYFPCPILCNHHLPSRLYGLRFLKQTR